MLIMKFFNQKNYFTKRISLLLLTLLLALFSLFFLYFLEQPLFIQISKILIVCLSFYLILSCVYAFNLTQNLFLTVLSFFYGLINSLQLLYLILPPVYKIIPYEISCRTYFIGRISFALFLCCVSFLYAHKKYLVTKFTIWSAVFFVVSIPILYALIDPSFIVFLKQHSIAAFCINFMNRSVVPFAYVIAYINVNKFKNDFRNSHKMILFLFFVVSMTMELIDLFYFIPLSAPLIYNNLFKIASLSLLLIGQIDCCVLYPLYKLSYENNSMKQAVSLQTENISTFSKHIHNLTTTLEHKTNGYEKLIQLFKEPFLICIGDKIFDANRSALDLFGVNSKHVLVGQSILSCIHSNLDLHKELSTLKDSPNIILKGSGTFTPPSQQSNRDIEFLFTSIDVYDLSHIICLIQDVSLKTKHKATKQALKEQCLKFTHFSGVSHDIKTPINIIYSSLQMQSQCTTMSECQHYTEIMQRNCLKLLRLLNNLLDLTKIDNKMLSMSPQSFDVIVAIETLCEISYYYMQEKQISYVFDTDMDEKIVHLDPIILERIIFNLLSNAIKYTPSGGNIEISLFELPDNASIAIHIKDSGVGIPEDKLAHIFDRFTTVSENSKYSKEHSCGIGLSIVYDLVHLLDGSIECKSTLNQGCEFIVSLPTPNIDSDGVSGPYVTSHSTHNIKVEFCDL